MNLSKQKLVGLGEVLWDCLPAGRRLGGAPANCAFHAHQMGIPSAVVSAVGEDDDGWKILQQLGAMGLDCTGLAMRADLPTSRVTVKMRDGQPSYTIRQPVAWDGLTLTHEAARLAQECAAVCFGSLAQRSEESREMIQEFLRATSESAWRIFDVNLRQDYYSADVLNASLELANVVKLNDEELPVLAELLALADTTADGRLAELRDRYSLHMVAYTSGAAGSVLLDAHQTNRLAGPPVTVEDTIGAGDSFTATLAVGLLQGWPLEEIHARAIQLAGYVCTQPGATPTHES
jgi:fructokinase